jgi:GT2 family glycosyltransferase
MSTSSATPARVRVDSKFFRLGEQKFYVKGITYGPFAPNAQNEMFPTREQTARDFGQIAQLGANLLRVYYLPPAWFLDLAASHGLKLLIDVPWSKHLCFLDSEESQQQARQAVRDAVQGSKGHPAVFAYSVVNEISAEIVRWSGVKKVERFIGTLVNEARSIAPDTLCTFTSFPPTEFLQAPDIDFVCFNVYLHHRKSLEAYLARLQTLADSKPLLLGEFGMDSMRAGEEHQSEFLGWQIETAFRAGLAGTVVFSYTDDWFRGGLQIEDWAFGLTTRERQPKKSFWTVQQKYLASLHSLLGGRTTRVSVVVASYNGGRTLQVCLQSLTHLNYSDYEVILVDDGSTDATPEIAKLFPQVRYIRQPNQGLSAARNAGIAAATGQIVAFTDDDCRADEDWLSYLVHDLSDGELVGIGGHNFLPPDDSCVAAAVLASPGGPAHVLLTDREAEHVPGCNMAFFKWALEEIGGFDPVFRKAGDDVDVCWRLQERGYKIGFSPAGFVWHYRRSTVQAYLKQQAGYGEAEALLARKHPRYFNSFGGGIWRGKIYGTGRSGVVMRQPVIYHGPFGSGFFQRLYGSEPHTALMLCTSLGFHTFVTVPLLLLSAYAPFLLPVGLASLTVSLGVCVLAAAQARLPRDKERFWSRPLLAMLFALQPVVRGWQRFKSRLNVRGSPPAALDEHLADAFEIPKVACFWTTGEANRYGFLASLAAKLQQQGWSIKADTGWDGHDFEIRGNLWSRLSLITVTEELEQNRKNFRCRLEGTWSLQAKIAFCILLGIAVFVIAVWAREMPWLWMLPLCLPLFYWFLEEEKAVLRQALASLLEETAREQNFTRIPETTDVQSGFRASLNVRATDAKEVGVGEPR